MVRRRSCAVSNHEAPMVPAAILRDARRRAPPAMSLRSRGDEVRGCGGCGVARRADRLSTETNKSYPPKRKRPPSRSWRPSQSRGVHPPVATPLGRIAALWLTLLIHDHQRFMTLGVPFGMNSRRTGRRRSSRSRRQAPMKKRRRQSRRFPTERPAVRHRVLR